MKLGKTCLIFGLGLAMAHAGEAVSDFQITDENPNSVRYGSSVSPRDYLLQVSGYYFGSAG